MTFASGAALFGTMLVLAFTPGPTEVAVVARSIASGVGHGLIMICGIVIADFLFIILAVAGLAATAEALGPLFLLVKLLAGAYLIVLGFGLQRASLPAASHLEPARSSWLASLSSGFVLTLGDPKAILGYMSLLPAFVDLSRVSINETATIMLLAAVAVGTAKICYVLMAERAVSMVESRRATSRVNLLAGGVLACVGLFLIAQSSRSLWLEA